MCLSNISNVEEKTINIQLIKSLEKINIIKDGQYGFRSSGSPSDMLSYIFQIWVTIEKYGEFQTVALDISKDIFKSIVARRSE